MVSKPAATIALTAMTAPTATPTPTIAPTATKTPTATPVPTISPTATPIPTIPPADSERTLKVGNLERSYLLHIPPNLDISQLVPVVFVFHGWRDNALSFQPVGFKEMADVNGFLIVTPNGSGPGSDTSWNAGGCCGSAATDTVDETAFVRQMLSDLGTIVKVDPRRIYAAGFSNGAMLVYRLACEMSDVFAAVAPVSGPLFYSPCQPQQPVSVVHVHGLADTVVPFTGGGDLIPGGFPAIDQGIATWVRLDGCNDSAQVVKLDSSITHTAYHSCRADSAVELYTIEGVGHGWPSSVEFPMPEVIWGFFLAHPKP